MPQAADRIEGIRKGAGEGEYIVLALCEVATHLARIAGLLKLHFKLEYGAKFEEDD